MKRYPFSILILFVAAMLMSSAAESQTQFKPYIMILLDTSSSMLINPCASTSDPECTMWETMGDGSDDSFDPGWGNAYPGIDTPTWDDDSEPNDSRLYIAKDAIGNVVNTYGDVTFGLMRYRATECILCYGDSTAEVVFPMYMDNMGAAAGGASFTKPGGWPTPPYQSGTHRLDIISYQGFISRDGNGRCEPLGAAGGDVLVGFDEDNQYDILEWIDHHEQFNEAKTEILNHEIRATGFTPLARSITAAHNYMVPLMTADPKGECRGYYLVIITDGEDTCERTSERSTNPPNNVLTLYNAGIHSYTIGFVSTAGVLDNMADRGDDGLLNGSANAFDASNGDEISAAFQSIIADTVLIEVCNEIDDDCDCPGDTDGDTIVCDPGDDGVDEGWPLFCDVQAEPPVMEKILCDDPGETVCDGVDDNCNCTADTNGDTVWCGPGDDGVDEGLLNACGDCGPIPEEICDGLDNDCDTVVDNPPVCDECTPQPEVCDGADNDCDGRVDEDLSRVCGRDIPPCTLGTQECVEDGAGVWTDCTGVTPEDEVCDGVDNDCDGIVDGMSEQCEMAEGVGDTGECTYGYTICVDSVWSDCQGGIGPRDEVCDNKDNDCDGDTDEDNPGGGARCGTEEGECREGTLECRSGSLICVDEIGPVDEECDGLDNDCDGTVDEGNPGGGEACGPTDLDGIGLCRAGIITCITDGYGEAHFECVGSVYPEDETCNCLDDDCDTVPDNDLPAGVECGYTDEGECEYGELVCDPVGCEWVCEDEVGPVDELCDGLDNNCDGTVDEGNPEGGGGCGETEGECEPGVLWCKTSDTPPPCEPPDPLPEDEWLLCLCGKGPVDEVCNGLDDDCDGDIDEGLGVGDECGETEGECEPGVYMCIDGEVVCVGGRGPQREICDCLDNDCDTEIDEDDPCSREGEEEEAVCYHDTSTDTCYCVEPCNPSLEFPCTETGQVCMELDGHVGFYCVGDLCADVVCDDDEECWYGDCVLICADVSCPEGEVCVVIDGRGLCVEANCYVDDPELQCEEGERCRNGECEPDPCYEVDCPDGQFCREGECYESCEGEDIIICDEGYYCYDGECVEDKCWEADCPSGEVCDPETGDCISDPCSGVTCLYPLICVDGECVDPPCSFVDCPEGYVCVDDTCVNEETIPDEEEAPPEAVPDRADVVDAAEDGDEGETGSWDVMATGGGGCAGCTMAGGTSSSGGGRTGLLVLLIAAALMLGFNRKHGGRPFRAVAGEEEDGQ